MAALFSFRKNHFFGRNIEPACEYCENGSPTIEGNMIKCRYKGIIPPYYQCKKFVYAPLKRIPHRRPSLPEYDPDDFKI